MVLETQDRAEITNFQGETAVDGSADVLASGAGDVIRRVGARVRKAREMRGLARRVVSERSGVSPRYLAQLEAGDGNISIGLLQRVATALDLRIEWLIGEEDPWTSEALRIADLYRSATTEKRKLAMEALSAAPAEELRARRVCLIGLRGAGKSTLGAMAARALDAPFLELNAEIEEHAGMPVAEVLALYGAEGYRQLEGQALGRIISTHETVILAAAGGIVAEPEGFKTLLAHFHTIWIKASPEEHMSRVRGQGDTRPMAGNPEAMTQLRNILKNREPLYRQALVSLDTSGEALEASAGDLVALIRENGFL